jgi:hypothetical protein
MSEINKPTQEEIKKILSDFEEKYHMVLSQLDSLYKGTFDENESSSLAAFCLISQAALLEELAAAELRARALKRDIDFAKADAYSKLKSTPSEKKVTETALAQLLVKDDEVKRITKEQNEAERDAKHLANIYALLREAHLTFRSLKKGG